MESSFHLNFIQIRSIPIISYRFKLEDIYDLARFFREFLSQNHIYDLISTIFIKAYLLRDIEDLRKELVFLLLIWQNHLC